MPNNMPVFCCRGFHSVKDGSSSEEYEDAFASIPEKGRFAVADGASESSYAGNWARLLVNGAVKKPGPWSRWLPAARLHWQQSFQAEELPWYAEEKAAQGAHATLLTLRFRTGDDASPGRWLAQAVGDTCLFVVRGNRLQRAFPLTNSEQFGSTPSLICSRRLDPTLIRPKRFSLQGQWNPEDWFFLMTDALAQWFLKESEARRKPWRQLKSFQNESEFVAWLNALRVSRALRNDDVTLLTVHATPSVGLV